MKKWFLTDEAYPVLIGFFVLVIAVTSFLAGYYWSAPDAPDTAAPMVDTVVAVAIEGGYSASQELHHA